MKKKDLGHESQAISSTQPAIEISTPSEIIITTHHPLPTLDGLIA